MPPTHPSRPAQRPPLSPPLRPATVERLPPRTRVLMPVTLTALAAYVVLLAALGDLRPQAWLVAGASLAFAAPFAVLARDLWSLEGRSRAFWLYVVVGATLLRLPLLYTQPSLSDDIYRYVWDGAQQRHGVNPYRHPPDAEAVAHLRDPLWERVNHKHVPTIYPPLAEALFLAADTASHSVRAQKLLVLAFDVGLIFVLGALCDARKVPRARVLLYAWHPLVLVEVAGSGHNDSIALFFLLLGLLLVERGRGRGALAALAAGTLTKFWGAVAAPFAAQRTPRRWWWIFPALVVTAYLPYAGAGTGLFAGLGAFASDWEFNHGVFRVASWALASVGVADPRLPLKVLFGLGGLACLVFLLRRRTDPLRATFLLTVYALLVSPTVHPWYVLWLVPFLVYVNSWGLLCWTFTVSLAYHVMPAYAANGIWQENLWIVALEYLPVFGVCGWAWARRYLAGRGV